MCECRTETCSGAQGAWDVSQVLNVVNMVQGKGWRLLAVVTQPGAPAATGWHQAWVAHEAVAWAAQTVCMYVCI